MSNKVYTTTSNELASQTITSSFTTDGSCLDGFRGFAYSFVTSDRSTNLDMQVSIEVSACSNNNYSVLDGSMHHLVMDSDNTETFVVSEAFYKYVRIRCTVLAGSCTMLIELTKKS